MLSTRFAAASKPWLAKSLGDRKHLNPNRKGRQKQGDRGQCQRLFDNCADHDLALRLERRGNNVPITFQLSRGEQWVSLKMTRALFCLTELIAWKARRCRRFLRLTLVRP
jgi:hypothetical protein